MDKDITSQSHFSGYDEEVVSLTKCACGQIFPPWEFTLSIYRDSPTECPNCHRKMYASIGVRVYEVDSMPGVRENILTGFAAELMAMLTEAQEENDQLKAIEAAVTAYLTAKNVPAAKRAYTELWRASGLDREKFLRGESQ